MPAIAFIPPQTFYHRLRKQLAPTFSPCPELEVEYWQRFGHICDDHNWDPYSTIEVVFQYIAWRLSKNERNFPYKRGYPNVSQMADESLMHLAWTACQGMEPHFKFTPAAEQQLQNQFDRLRRTVVSTGKPIDEIVAGYDHLPIWPLLRLALNPEIRAKFTTPAQIKTLLNQAADPTVWTAFEKLGIPASTIYTIQEFLTKPCPQSKQTPA